MTERREDKQPDTVEIIKMGGSYYYAIPPRQIRYLDLDEHSTLQTQTEHSQKYGRYLTGWNQAQQGSPRHGTDRSEPVDVLKNGDSLYRRLPPEQRDYLEVTEGTTLKTQLEYSDEYGRYISEWNPAQQDGDT